jgi:hypothetical protein
MFIFYSYETIQFYSYIVHSNMFPDNATHVKNNKLATPQDLPILSCQTSRYKSYYNEKLVAISH